MTSQRANLFLVGSMKSGTTSLAAMLDAHPDVCVSNPKEPHFFSTQPRWRNQLGSYHELFQPATRFWCDASTSYTMLGDNQPRVWSRIYEYYPQAIILYLMRHPLERLISNYAHNWRRHYTSLSIADELTQHPDRTIDRGRYAAQIIPYIETFGQDRVHLLFFEDLTQKRSEFLEALGGTLGLDPSQFEPKIHANRTVGVTSRSPAAYKQLQNFNRSRVRSVLGPWIPKGFRQMGGRVVRGWITRNDRVVHEKPKIPYDLARRVLDFYEPETRLIEQLTGRDLSAWRSLPEKIVASEPDAGAGS